MAHEPGWTVRGIRGDVWLTTGAPSGVGGLAATAASAMVDVWFPHGFSAGVARGQLVEIARALRVPATLTSAHDPQTFHRLREVVRQALRDGRLQAHALRGPGPATTPAVQPDAPFGFLSPPLPVADQDTWIALHLVDDADPPQPVAYARYVITLPDGTVREGTLDRMGLARIDGIPAGLCTVAFPDHDARTATVPARRAVKPPPRRARRVAPPPPAPPPPTAPTDGRVACKVTALAVTDHTLGARPADTARRLIQVVPRPDFSVTGSVALDEHFNPAFLEKLKDWGEVMNAVGDGRGFKTFASELASAKEDEKNAHHGRETKLTPSVALFTLGHARVRARPVSQPPCGRQHPIRLSGVKPGTYALEEAIRLTHDGVGDGGKDAPPTVYTLAATGCGGADQTVQVEVFPSDQVIVSAGLEITQDRWEPVVRAIEVFLGTVVDITLATTLEGSLSAMWGWRADSESWRAYHTRDVALKGGFKLAAGAVVSVARLAFQIPTAVSDYLADLRVGVTVTLGAESGLTWSARDYPARGAEAEHTHTVEGEFTMRGAAALDLHAHLGAKRVMGVEAYGDVTGALRCTSKLEATREAVEATVEVVRERSVVAIHLVFTTLVKEWRKDLDVFVWDEKRLLPPEEDNPEPGTEHAPGTHKPFKFALFTWAGMRAHLPALGPGQAVAG